MHLSLVVLFVGFIHVNGGWIDSDTPDLVKLTKSLVENKQYSLVFSDEFNTAGRSFNDGTDPRWTSLDKNDYTNYALHYYKSEMASTSNGYLNITTIVQDTTYNVEEVGRTRKETKHYQSAMIQGWNKFCFTGGIVEISAKLPGRYDIGGLWPAMWLLGNLARATYVSSSNNVWPWSYDTCSTGLQHQQLISKCNAVNHFDLHPHQGRGAPEVDILEAMPGKEKLVNTPVHKPYYSASYQVSPGYTPYRPTPAEPPAPGLWYEHGLEYGENTSQNIFFYGMNLAGAVKSESYIADAISANRNLSETHFTDFHKYRIEWVTGEQGHLQWFLDDKFVFSIAADALNLTGAIIPEEPMYLIMNTGLSSTWGFPTPCPADCPCSCFDCRRWECQCGVPFGMCDNLPAHFLIDYIRVYQDDSNEDQIVGCSTPSHPTKKFIQAHSTSYMAAGATQPLMPVSHGGGSCAADGDCGTNGTCSRGHCRCTEQFTGPHCRSPQGFDDTVWDVEPPMQIYRMYLPISLIVLAVIVATLFAALVVYNYATDRGLTSVPWKTADLTAAHGDRVQTNPYYHAASTIEDFDGSVRGDGFTPSGVQMGAANRAGTGRIRDRVEQ